ncbi:superoxide dismutase family protein [Rhizorhapis suberifaciens]|uniref:Cu-Zn family superoxide dismutase n=1 Tax=Rhizorhapis suberifaciens TaxID=13656 RepID=A0A840HVT3_9SPHN|nr:superoxide dismutase family protein [Rhizorhapis suberifaciens]MBB4641586.1 Cu-Zn family superoxide dismutase [Rhizorhapis suberifaciens]
MITDLRLSLLIAPIFLSACAAATNETESTSGTAVQTAIASLRAPDGSARGEVRAVAETDGIRLTINGVNLPAGSHGAHIHMTGACTPPDFASAGGHWNPTGHQHGKNNPQGMHMGDLPNLLIGTDGRGTLEITIPGARLSEGSNALLDADGSAFVVHGGPDDMMTDPSGNSGGRIACGVFAAG